MATHPRVLEGALRAAASQYPIVTVTGPRQSGKSTLCRHVFPDKPYLNLEAVDRREFARQDPRGLLASVADGAIIDEVQHAPDLLSYLQLEVDERPDPGRFILTGSQNLTLSAAVSQSLAGRTAVLHLLPMARGELLAFGDAGDAGDLSSALWSGGYPAIFDRGIPPDRWLSDYVTTYLQRDVRQLQNVQDLEAFTRFVRLCAGRTGSELNLVALGADAGISHNTARQWLSILEVTFVCMRLPAWHRNVRKQLIKAPKLHFIDVGLACSLIGVRGPADLDTHPLRGALFESWVVGELYKAIVHAGEVPRMFHLRATRGPEIDLIVERGRQTLAIECKSGATLASEWLTDTAQAAQWLTKVGGLAKVEPVVVYGGSLDRLGTARALGWRSLTRPPWVDHGA